MRTYGSATLSDGVWTITAEPHVAIEFKRVFPRVDASQVGEMKVKDSPEICRRLKWFADLYPIEFNGTARHLEDGANRYVQDILTRDQLLAGSRTPKQFKLAIAPRKYQAQAAEMYLLQKSLLVADDVGLGKTAISIATFTEPKAMPAIVVCHPFLQRQWKGEIERFAPGLHVHIIEKMRPYPLAVFMGRLPDVVIITYHKLHSWSEVLSGFAKSIVFDEAQELRHNNSDKYGAAEYLSTRVPYKLGLSATPLHNFGGEMFNVLSILKPDCLGTREEFHREWCTPIGNGKHRIDDPKAFGMYLRDQGMMIRRTRAEVGRELPPIIKVPHQVSSDDEKMAQAEGQAAELARIIMSATESYKGQRLQASGQLDAVIRQATGVAKAPFVAEFVSMLVESGERVLLAGWHRAVYDVWRERFDHMKVRHAMFTGSESLVEKERARELFIRGELDVLIISNRAGAGLNGFQNCCKIVVFGELDYSPAVMEQMAGRIHRDGQQEAVTAYFLISEAGSDPLMVETLGLKSSQLNGIRNPKGNLIEKLQTNGDHVRKLAMKYLSKQVIRRPAVAPRSSPPIAVKPAAANPVQSKWKISFARPMANA